MQQQTPAQALIELGLDPDEYLALYVSRRNRQGTNVIVKEAVPQVLLEHPMSEEVKMRCQADGLRLSQVLVFRDVTRFDDYYEIIILSENWRLTTHEEGGLPVYEIAMMDEHRHLIAISCADAFADEVRAHQVMQIQHERQQSALPLH